MNFTKWKLDIIRENRSMLKNYNFDNGFQFRGVRVVDSYIFKPMLFLQG